MNLIDEVLPMQAPPLAEPAGSPRAELQRGLAIAQQVKDSITIVLMLSTGLLLFGICFGIAIPGLVFYAKRWKQVRRAGSQASGGGLWLLTLLHELLWTVVFYSGHPQHDEMTVGHLEVGYALGALISLAGLLNSGWLLGAKARVDGND